MSIYASSAAKSKCLSRWCCAAEYFADQALDVGMAEVALIPDSEMIGKTVREIAFRTRFGSQYRRHEARWQSDGWFGGR